MSFPFLDFESSFFTNEELLFLAGASGGGVEHTIINNPATFTTDLAKPLRRLLIPFTSESGLTGVNINRTGKNLFHSTFINANVSSDSGVIGSSNTRIASDFVELPTGSYTVSLKESKQVTIYFYAAANVDSYIYSERISSWSNCPKSFTISARRFAIFVFRNSDNSNIAPSDVSEVQVELGTASEHTTYSGTTIPVSWQTEAGAVNEGELDALTGVLTVTTPESKTVQLDPVTLSTLKGENVVWTDTNGDNTIVYLKKT